MPNFRVKKTFKPKPPEEIVLPEVLVRVNALEARVAALEAKKADANPTPVQ